MQCKQHILKVSPAWGRVSCVLSGEGNVCSVHVHVSGEQKLILNVFLHCFPIHVLTLASVMKLAIQLVPENPCLHLPSAEVTDRPWFPSGFSMSAKDLNFSPHACMASILYIGHPSSSINMGSLRLKLQCCLWLKKQ